MEEVKVSVETITRELEEDRRLAHDTKAAGAAVSATMGKAKLHGLLVDKDASAPKNPLEGLSASDLLAIRDFIAERRRSGLAEPGNGDRPTA